MKTSKKIRKRNQRIVIITVFAIIIILIVFNFSNIIDGFKDGMKAAQQSF